MNSASRCSGPAWASSSSRQVSSTWRLSTTPPARVNRFRPAGSLGERPARAKVPGHRLLVREDQVGEAEHAAVHADVLAFAGVEPVPGLGRLGMVRVGEQPFLPSGAEGELEVIPFPLVGGAAVDDPPARGPAGLEQAG